MGVNETSMKSEKSKAGKDGDPVKKLEKPASAVGRKDKMEQKGKLAICDASKAGNKNHDAGRATGDPVRTKEVPELGVGKHDKMEEKGKLALCDGPAAVEEQNELVGLPAGDVNRKKKKEKHKEKRKEDKSDKKAGG